MKNVLLIGTDQLKMIPIIHTLLEEGFFTAFLPRLEKTTKQILSSIPTAIYIDLEEIDEETLIVARDLKSSYSTRGAKIIGICPEKTPRNHNFCDFYLPYKCTKVQIQSSINKVINWPKKILVVEDDIDILNIIHSSLSLNYEVYNAQDGITALDYFKEHSFHCILSDINMPRMDGVSLVKQIRKRDKKIPIITFSGFGAEGLTESIKSGSNTIIEKPIPFEKLHRVISNLIYH